MADKVVFAIGTQFESFSDLERRIAKYEKQEFCVFSVAPGKLLQSNENISAEVVEKIKYGFRRYQCLFYGVPRKKNQDDVVENDNDNEVGNHQNDENAGDDGIDNAQGEQNQPARLIKRRQSKSYRQNCSCYFTIRHHEQNGTPVLHIVALNENLQSHITNTSTTNAAVERSDLYNFRNLKINNSIGINDFTKMVNEMLKIKDSTVAAYYNSENELKAIYFQDDYMKKVFDAYPELLLFDATFSLNDRRMPLIVLMIVDGNGNSQIVGLFLALSENAAAMTVFFEKFKEVNPNWQKIEVILTDKGAVNLAVAREQFPESVHHLCVFPVYQTFQREVNTKKEV